MILPFCKKAGVPFLLSFSRLVDGEHYLRMVSKYPNGKEGIRKITFTVRKSPDISVEGLHDHQIVDGVIPVMIIAYGKRDQKIFLKEGSKVPKSIPGWIWIVHLLIGAWAIYYFITQLAAP